MRVHVRGPPGVGPARDVVERPYTAGGGGGTSPDPPYLPPLGPPPPPPPPLPMFEADSQNFASAHSVPRGFKLQNFRPAFSGDHRRRGGPAEPPPPPPFRPPPPLPPLLLILPWGPLYRCAVGTAVRTAPPQHTPCRSHDTNLFYDSQIIRYHTTVCHIHYTHDTSYQYLSLVHHCTILCDIHVVIMGSCPHPHPGTESALGWF